MAALARLAGNGILIKSGAALEMLARIRIAAFDKTGTLTLGHPVVTDVVGDPAKILGLAASVENGLSHPVARAIVSEASRRSITLSGAEGVRIRQGEGDSPKAKRIEFRVPDPSANPYLAFSAMLMAGIDGIQNKIHPGEAMDKNLYDLPPAELAQVPTVCGSLREALDSLEADHDFLLQGGVFTKDQIDAYIELKWPEVLRWETTPSAVEFDMYYSA